LTKLNKKEKITEKRGEENRTNEDSRTERKKGVMMENWGKTAVFLPLPPFLAGSIHTRAIKKYSI
jgi:hypothetical protein